MAIIPKNYARLESGYREKALKLFPWVCGRCSREFVYSNLRELTVHHIDHDHTNNPEDGSNWELLCLYCHDHEHSKYTEADQYGSTVIAGEDAQKDVGEATYNPFADLKAMMNKRISRLLTKLLVLLNVRLRFAPPNGIRNINELLVFVDRMQSDIFSAPEFVASPQTSCNAYIVTGIPIARLGFFVFKSCRYWRAE